MNSVVKGIISEVRPNVSPVSRETYLRSITSILKKLGVSVSSKEDVDKFLKGNKEKQYKEICGLSQSKNTVKGFINAIVILSDSLKDEQITKFWKQKRDSISDDIKTDRSSTELTPEQAKAMVSNEEYRTVLDNVFAQLRKYDYFKGSKKTDVMKLSMIYLMLLIYYKFNLRVDIVNLVAISFADYGAITDKGKDDENYLVYDDTKKTGKYQLIIYNSKSQKNSDFTAYVFDTKLKSARDFLKQYVENLPCKYCFWKLRNDKYRSFTAEEVSKYFKMAWVELTDKPFTITLNRIRLASSPENVKLKESFNNIKAEAENALHSSEQHLLYVKNIPNSATVKKTEE